jgi:hypothetical protein
LVFLSVLYKKNLEMANIFAAEPESKISGAEELRRKIFSQAARENCEETKGKERKVFRKSRDRRELFWNPNNGLKSLN